MRKFELDLNDPLVKRCYEILDKAFELKSVSDSYGFIIKLYMGMLSAIKDLEKVFKSNDFIYYSDYKKGTFDPSKVYVGSTRVNYDGMRTYLFELNNVINLLYDDIMSNDVKRIESINIDNMLLKKIGGLFNSGNFIYIGDQARLARLYACTIVNLPNWFDHESVNQLQYDAYKWVANEYCKDKSTCWEEMIETIVPSYHDNEFYRGLLKHNRFNIDILIDYFESDVSGFGSKECCLEGTICYFICNNLSDKLKVLLDNTKVKEMLSVKPTMTNGHKLHYIKEYGDDKLIDVHSTLRGAILQRLHHKYGGLLAHNEAYRLFEFTINSSDCMVIECLRDGTSYKQNLTSLDKYLLTSKQRFIEKYFYDY